MMIPDEELPTWARKEPPVVMHVFFIVMAFCVFALATLQFVNGSVTALRFDNQGVPLWIKLVGLFVASVFLVKTFHGLYAKLFHQDRQTTKRELDE